MMLSQPTTAGQPQQMAQMDAVISNIKDEVLRYENRLYLLVSKLETSRPEDGCGVTAKCQPATMGDALQDIYKVLINNNEYLQRTIDRVNEQVGELKLLP